MISITIQISRRTVLLLATTIILAVPVVLIASQVSLPYTFTAGTPASASQVNDNFDALRGAVNDNDFRLGNAVSDVAAIDTRVTSLEGNVGGSWGVGLRDNGGRHWHAARLVQLHG